MNIADDIKTVLEFYQAIGFGALPLKTVITKQLPAAVQKTEIKFPATKAQQPAARALQTPKTPTFQIQPVDPFSSEIKMAELEALKEEIGDCQRCKLSKGRTKIVFGEGNPEAPLMFIGEAPGREEDVQGRPFVGDAGELLTNLIVKMGFKREDLYIGNIVKCKPPFNRDPEEDEIAACLPFIEKQVGIISPDVIFSLGRIASHTLTKSKIPITKLRGRFCEYKGIPVMPTFHPAYLLRNPKDKFLVWDDAQKVIEELKKRGRIVSGS